MNPFVLFLLAIVSPLLLAVTVLVPPYAGMVAAAYIIYDKGTKIHPLADKLGDVFYMIDVYMKLFMHWTKHITEMDVWTYTLPLLALPLIGFALMFWLTGKLARKLMDIFQLGVAH